MSLKKSSVLIVICALMIASCSKSPSTNPDLCSDKLKDGSETEIDCGGSCSPCPAGAALSGTFGADPYVASNISKNYNSPTDALQISTTGTANESFSFEFVGTNIGVSNVTNASGNFSFNSYSLSPSRPGTVTITSKDSLRNIISGSFHVNLIEYGVGTQDSIVGSFTNVRIN